MCVDERENPFQLGQGPHCFHLTDEPAVRLAIGLHDVEHFQSYRGNSPAGSLPHGCVAAGAELPPQQPAADRVALGHPGRSLGAGRRQHPEKFGRDAPSAFARRGSRAISVIGAPGGGRLGQRRSRFFPSTGRSMPLRFPARTRIG